MKTEPTEAKQMLEDSWLNSRTAIALKIDAFRAVNIAFQEGQSNLIVKQLEWAEGFFALLSDTPFGIYQILKPAGTHSAHIIYLNDKPILIVSDLNEAKSAAQADFEKRIKECLIIE